MGRTFMTVARGALPLRGRTHETTPAGTCSKAAFVWRVCVINVPLLRLNLEPSASCAGMYVCMYVCMYVRMREHDRVQPARARRHQQGHRGRHVQD